MLCPNPVDAAESLYELHGIPMEVVVQDAGAILEILAFRHHVSREQDANLWARQ